MHLQPLLCQCSPAGAWIPQTPTSNPPICDSLGLGLLQLADAAEGASNPIIPALLGGLAGAALVFTLKSKAKEETLVAPQVQGQVNLVLMASPASITCLHLSLKAAPSFPSIGFELRHSRSHALSRSQQGDGRAEGKAGGREGGSQGKGPGRAGSQGVMRSL